jgi:hypothetical protein
VYWSAFIARKKHLLQNPFALNPGLDEGSKGGHSWFDLLTTNG